MTQSEFEDVVRENQSMVYSIAYNFFGNAALAEEVAQDVFLQLLREPLCAAIAFPCDFLAAAGDDPPVYRRRKA